VYTHRVHIREALIALFESSVPESDLVDKKVLTRNFCNPALNFDKPIFGFKEDSNPSFMVTKDVTPGVWEAKERRTVKCASPRS
jgi:hypothetical protein